MKISNFHHYINIVESRISSSPPTIQCINDSEIHCFDREMVDLSIGLSQYLMMERLIRHVRVRRTRNKYATYTDKLHLGESADILVWKGGIGLVLSGPAHPNSPILG